MLIAIAMNTIYGISASEIFRSPGRCRFEMCQLGLGEEVLSIQKEFDGFDETRERLNLPALDKDGNPVVFDNKLGDSVRGVTWQVLKFVAYLSVA